MSSLKLISLNIERSKHLDLVVPFLQKERPDVLCIQELMERDVLRFEEALGMRCVFSPFTLHDAEWNAGIMGIGIFSLATIRSHEARYYVGDPSTVPIFDFTDVHTKHATENHSVIFCDIKVGNDMYRIGTTHFTWTPDGAPDDYQREDAKRLLNILDSFGEFVLTGDFNSARGSEIFSLFAKRYKDNIPRRYTTTIDGALHRAGPLECMVDGVFSTSGYVVSDVELISGVSDHMAVVATISKS